MSITDEMSFGAAVKVCIQDCPRIGEWKKPFINKWFGEESNLGYEWYSVLSQSKYSRLNSEIRTPTMLGASCLLIERTGFIPKQMSHQTRERRLDWILSCLDEVIQYPPEMGLDSTYLTVPGGVLPIYVALAKVIKYPELPPFVVREFFEDYIPEWNFNPFSLEEHGIITIRIEDGYYVWVDNSVHSLLKNYPPTRLMWLRGLKVSQQLKVLLDK